MTGGAGPTSRRLFRRARRALVGGVDSPVRSFQAVGGSPVFFRSGRGAYLADVDGRRYLDLVNSWGADLLGHAPPAVLRAVRAVARDGLSFGAPSPLEHELAERIERAIPEIERLRFVTSGTEAVMSAVRVARAATSRSKVVKFDGGYHGHSDGLLVRAGSGVLTHAQPGSAGVPESIAAETLVVPYNDVDALAELFEHRGREIAAVVVEPIAANMGLVPPTPGFLPSVSRLAHANGAVVIADEVITGFRLRRGAVARTLGLDADLVALGKVIGGGLPIGAYGGRAALMDRVAPSGPVYQAGTLAGNPLAMAAGAAVLDAISPTDYRRLERTAADVERAWKEALEGRLEPWTLHRRGSMFGLFFAAGPIVHRTDAERTDRARYATFFHHALDAGVYLPPSPLETAFLSLAFGPSEVARLARALGRAAARSALEGGCAAG